MNDLCPMLKLLDLMYDETSSPHTYILLETKVIF